MHAVERDFLHFRRSEDPHRAFRIELGTYEASSNPSAAPIRLRLPAASGY